MQDRLYAVAGNSVFIFKFKNVVRERERERERMSESVLVTLKAAEHRSFVCSCWKTVFPVKHFKNVERDRERSKACL